MRSVPQDSPESAFLRSKFKEVMSKLAQAVNTIAEEKLAHFGQRKLSNVLLLEIVDEIQYRLPAFWTDIVSDIVRVYSKEFGAGLSKEAIQDSNQIFETNLAVITDNIVRQVLRWPLEIKDTDLVKLEHLFMQNLKGVSRRALARISRKSPSDFDVGTLSDFDDEAEP